MIIPLIHSTNLNRSLEFNTKILGFDLIGRWPESGDPAFAELRYQRQEIHISSHRDDGISGNVISIIVDDIQKTYAQYLSRGLRRVVNPDSPVHEKPILQTWGNVEFYIDDPDQNTIRIIQRPA